MDKLHHSLFFVFLMFFFALSHLDLPTVKKKQIQRQKKYK